MFWSFSSKAIGYQGHRVFWGRRDLHGLEGHPDLVLSLTCLFFMALSLGSLKGHCPLVVDGSNCINIELIHSRGTKSDTKRPKCHSLPWGKINKSIRTWADSGLGPNVHFIQDWFYTISNIYRIHHVGFSIQSLQKLTIVLYDYSRARLHAVCFIRDGL